MRDQVYTLLAKCRDQFRFYVVQHQQKNPPQEDKARVNAAIADEIEAQLNIRDPDNEHATMVAQLQKPGQDIMQSHIKVATALAGSAAHFSEPL